MDQHKCSLLVVDDEPYIPATLAATLASDFEVETANSADAAEAVFRRRRIDLVLTDQNMPRRTGIQLLEWVRENYPRTVRLLMTGYTDMEVAVDAINRGQIYHYINKPWRNEELQQVLRNAAEKCLLERSNDELLVQLRQLNQELEQRVAQRTQALEEANRNLRQQAEEMKRLALTCPLTGLYNRRAMEQLAEFELKRHSRYPSPVAVGLVDVDFFKRINTTYLLTGGDSVLKGLAQLLQNTVREVDSVGRIGGEEFLVLARETDKEGTFTLAERLREAVEKTPLEWQGHAIHITISLGFAVADIGMPATLQEMMEVAASALNEAKRLGRNRAVIRSIRSEALAHGLAPPT